MFYSERRPVSGRICHRPNQEVRCLRQPFPDATGHPSAAESREEEGGGGPVPDPDAAVHPESQRGEPEAAHHRSEKFSPPGSGSGPDLRQQPLELPEPGQPAADTGACHPEPAQEGMII